MKKCLHCSNTFINDSWKCPKCAYLPNIIEEIPVFSPTLAHENEGFKEDFFALLASLEEKNFWFKSRNNAIIQIIKNYFSNAENYMEIGCGTGFVVCGIKKEFPSLTITATEIFLKGLSFARKRTRANFLQMNAKEIPFVDEFDVIGAFDVLEHIDDDTLVLQQLYQAVRPGGGIIITVPQHQFMWSKTDEYACHKRRYSRSELIDKLEKTGFKLTYINSFVFFLFPLMCLSRIFKGNNIEADPLAELKINPRINSIFQWILDMENLMASKGITYPFGGSLIAVGMKEIKSNF